MRPPRRASSSGRGRSRGRWLRSSGVISIEGEVELEHVHAGLAEEAEAAVVGVLVDQGVARRRAGMSRSAATRFAWIRALAIEISGSTPDAEVITASGGMSAAVSPGL